MPWTKSFCPFRACCFKELLPLQVVLLAFSLRAASSLSFGRGDKAAESGDVDYEYHHIIKGLYATFSSWHIDPYRFPVKCGRVYISDVSHNIINAERLHKAACWRYSLVDDKAT